MSTANDRCIQYPYVATSDTSEDKELWYVSVPAVDYIREAFFGAISTLGFPESYNPISDVAAEYGSEISASLTQIVPPEEVTVPGQMSRVYLSQVFATRDVGNNFAYIGNSVQLGGYAQQNPAAVNDQWRHEGLQLRPGTWQCKLWYVKTSANGQLYLRLNDGTDTIQIFGALETYQAGATVFNQMALSNFDIDAESTWDLIGQAISKNASSTGFQLLITAISLQRLP